MYGGGFNDVGEQRGRGKKRVTTRVDSETESGQGQGKKGKVKLQGKEKVGGRGIPYQRATDGRTELPYQSCAAFMNE